MVHQKADGVAVLAAAEAVIELLGRADAEAGRLLAMKRAQPHEIGAALFELHVAADHFDHVDAREQFGDERLGNGHKAILTDRAQAGRRRFWLNRGRHSSTGAPT
jgi:hypothetical protein